jgi:hypothetical protein
MRLCSCWNVRRDLIPGSRLGWTAIAACTDLLRRRVWSQRDRHRSVSLCNSRFTARITILADVRCSPLSSLPRSALGAGRAGLSRARYQAGSRRRPEDAARELHP